MQRTDQAERFLEKLASVPLTWENVFRSPKYTDKTEKEVVDLLLVLRNKGIFISMKCQQDPETRSGEKLARWVQKNAEAALKQVGGAIKTSKTREFWCSHRRRGQVFFEPNQIDPIRALVIVETLEEIALSETAPLEIDSVPVSYLSLEDFINILLELRTINDLILYLEARCSICPGLQQIIGIEKVIFEFYVLYGGSPREVDTLQDILEEIDERKTEIENLIRKREAVNLQAEPIERVSDRLSTRLEKYEEGLDEEIVRRFDPTSERSNYLLMQDELCDLVLDERRKLGTCLTDVIKKVKEDHLEGLIGYEVAHLDSKPSFLYVFSSSKGMHRNEVIMRCSALIQSGLAYYRKTRGLLVNYTQDRDGYDAVFIPSFEETTELIQMGRKRFGSLKMFDVPIEKV